MGPVREKITSGMPIADSHSTCGFALCCVRVESKIRPPPTWPISPSGMRLGSSRVVDLSRNHRPGSFPATPMAAVNGRLIARSVCAVLVPRTSTSGHTGPRRPVSPPNGQKDTHPFFFPRRPCEMTPLTVLRRLLGTTAGADRGVGGLLAKRAELMYDPGPSLPTFWSIT